MSQPLTVELSDAAFRALQQRAQATGKSLAEFASIALERQLQSGATNGNTDERQPARDRFERHFGELNLGHTFSADNDSIDADLAVGFKNASEKS